MTDEENEVQDTSVQEEIDAALEEELDEDVERLDSDAWFDGDGSGEEPAEAEGEEAQAAEGSETEAGKEGEASSGDESSEEPAPVGEKAENEPKPQEEASVKQTEPAPQEIPAGEQPPAEEQVNTQEWFARTVDALAQHVYAPDQETAELLDTEPSKVLPKIMAGMHMHVLTAAVTQIAQMVPSLVGQYQQAEESHRAAEQGFWEAFPELEGHKDEVVQIATMYRQMNPQADVAKATKDVAALAMVQLGVTPRQMQQQAAESVVSDVPPKPGAARGSAVPRAPKQLSEDDAFFEEMVREGY